MRKFKLFGRDIVIGKRLFGYGRDDESYFTLLTQRYGSDPALKERLDSYKAFVYACVRVIAEAVAGGYEPYFYKMNGDQKEKIQDHELLQLLRRPSGQNLSTEPMSMYTLLEATESFLQLQGSCYWYMGRGVQTGKPREIIILRADRVGTDIDKNTGDVNGYFIRRMTGDPIPLEVEEVLPFKLFDPKDAYGGYGPTEAAEDLIATDELTAKFVKNFFLNNAGLSGILEIKGEVTKDAFKKFVRAWRDKYEGVDAAGKLAIVRDSEAAFTKVGLGLNELDMGNLRQMSREDIAMAYGVPMPLLGKADQTGLGRGNVETLEYIFSKYNIEHKLKRYDAMLDFALERYWSRQDLIVGHKSIIPDDKEYELAKRTQSVDKWIKRNEIRDLDGLDPVDGGDNLYVPMANIPVADNVNSPTDVTNSLVIRRRLVLKATDIKVDHKETFRLRIMRNQGGYERHYRKVLKPIFREQKKEALNNLEAHAGGLTKDYNQKLFDDAYYDQLIAEHVIPVLRDLADTQGGLALVFAGDDTTKFVMTARLEAILANGTKNMASGFNDETIKRLNRTLAQGVADGESLSKLKSRVDDVYTEIEGYRSERIARTETLKASNSATTEGYRQTGYVNAKEWYVNPDACEICQEFDGKIVGLDESFAELGQSVDYTDAAGNDQSYTIDYDTVEEPPLHPNCRCTILPVR